MEINLKNVQASLLSLDVKEEHIENAIIELRALQSELDEVEVKGRQKVDTLLGCMMAIDSIIGKDSNNG